MAAKTLGSLLSDSIDFTKRRIVPIIVGAAIFGLVAYGVNWALIGSKAAQWTNEMAPWMQNMENMQANPQMEQMMQRMQSGDATEEDMRQIEAMGQQMMANAPQPGVVFAWVLRMLPYFGLAMLLSIIIGMIAKSYYTVVAVKDVDNPGTALTMTFAWLLKLVGLWFWMGLRSFIWIPILGLIPAIIIGPRLILAPLYLLEQKKGVFESATLSYRATEGYWGKIVGNGIVVGLCIAIISGILSSILQSIVGLAAGGIVTALLAQCFSAFTMVFCIFLGRTVMQNPKVAQ
jgi:hypothetical protein